MQIDSKILIESLKQIEAWAKGIQSVYFQVQSGKVTLQAVDPTISVQTLLIIEDTQAKLDFKINIKALIGVIKNRGLLKLEIKSNVLHIAAKNYKSSLAIERGSLETIVSESVKLSTLKSEQRQLFAEILPKMLLSSIMPVATTPTVIQLRCNAKETLISSTDNFHGFFYAGQPLPKHLNLDIPANIVSGLFLDFINLEPNGKIGSDDNQMYLVGENIQARISLVSSTDRIQACKKLVDNPPLAEFSLEKAILIQALDSIYTVFEQGSALTCNLDKEKLTISNATSVGSVEEILTVKGAKKISFNCNPHLLQAIVNKFKDTCEFNLCGKTSVPNCLVLKQTLKSGKFSAFCVLLGG